MSERNPKLDPRPGDVLRKKYQGAWFESRGYYTRTVYMVGPQIMLDGRNGVYYERTPSDARACRISEWRKWAKDAEVLTLGE